MLAGFIGSGTIYITCLKCGYRFKPGQVTVVKETPPVQIVGLVVLVIMLAVLVIGIVYLEYS